MQNKALKNNTPVIRNKKARFYYQVLETTTAGIVLNGIDVKFIRSSKVGILKVLHLLKGMNCF